MRVPVRSSLAALGAVLAATGLAVAVGPPVAAAAPAPAMPAPARTVRLLTGDDVRITPAAGGRTAVQVVTAARSGLGARWSQLTANGRTYVVPAVARPYLGGVLDPELFDVTPAADATTVDITFPRGHAAAVPGLTVTSSTATTAHGYLDAAGARRFGAALLARLRTDAVGAAPTSLFGASRIARSGVTPPVAPAFPQVTLTIRTLLATGRPGGFADVGLINTDDPRRYINFVFLQGGQGKVSVPLGHYSLITDISTFDPATTAFSDAIVSIPDTTVSRAGQTVDLDSRTATVVPSISTPHPAGLTELDLEYDRVVGQNYLGSGFGFGPGSDVRVAPAAAPRSGQVEFLTHWTLDGAPERGTPYRYDASYEDVGAIPADQHRVVATSQLATIDARYGTTGYPTTGYFGRTPAYPFQSFIFYGLFPQPAPSARTEYLVAPPTAVWLDSYIGAATDFNPFNGIVDDGFRVHPAGTRTTVDWLRGPLAPGVVEPTNGGGFFSNSCRTDGSLTVALAPFTDTTPGHIGSIVPADDSTVQTFTLTRDGTRVARGVDRTGGVFKVPAGPAVYVATVSTDAGFTGFTLSSHAVTSLTFPSSATSGAPLPTGWTCPSGDHATVLPLLTATVPLPTDLNGVMPIGTNSFVFRIAPAAGSTASDVVDVAMGVSLDNGVTFSPVAVAPVGGNNFRATITHPAAQAGRAVTLRLSGRTAAGSAISETVTHAYTVAGS